jgi:hypothetical protein
MAWWRPEEEASPQSRVGATTRPVEPGPESDVEPVQPVGSAGTQGPHLTAWQVESPVHAHPPLPRRRLPFNGPMAFFALVFVAVMVVPFILAFGVFFNEERISGGFDSPSSHDGPSMIPAKRFEKAMGRVRKEAGSEATLTAIRLAPDRVDATVRKAGGDSVLIQVLPDLSVRRFNAGSNGQRGLSLRRVDPRVPDRVVRAGAERLRVKRGDVSYLVLAATPTVGGGGIWSAYFGPGSYVIADLDGRNVRVPGQ